MAANPCLLFFSTCDPKVKVKELQKFDAAEVVNWERLTASAFSRSIVGKDEIVCRQLTHPTFYDEETGELKPTAFDDVSNKGLSVDRLKLTSREAIAARATSRNGEWNKANPTKDARTLRAIGHLSVARIRSELTDSARSFGVYDTALEDNVAHADVCQLIPGATGKEARSIRATLFLMVEYPQDPDVGGDEHKASTPENNIPL